MTFDPYDPCPCGSQKKLRFCCQDIAQEASKLSRLINDEQHHQALRLSDTLVAKFPDRLWITLLRADALMLNRRSTEARELLINASVTHRDNDNLLLALTALSMETEGVVASRRYIDRFLVRCFKTKSVLAGRLLAALAEFYGQSGNFLAEREHFSRSVLLASPEDRDAILEDLKSFEEDSAIPFPLRGPHLLPAISLPSLQADVDKATRFANVGAWGMAAEALARLTTQAPESAEIWHAHALCEALVGNEEVASTSFFEAAVKYTNFEQGVECAAYGFLTEPESRADANGSFGQGRVDIASSSVLTSRLDGQNWIERISPPGQSPVEYTVLSGPIFELTPENEPTVKSSDLPKILGAIIVSEASSDKSISAKCEFLVRNMNLKDDFLKKIRAVAGDALPAEFESIPFNRGQRCTLQSIVFQDRHFSNPFSRRTLARLFQQTIEEMLKNLPSTVFPQSGNRTFREAAADPSQHALLRGLALAIDASTREDLASREFDSWNVPSMTPLNFSDMPAGNLSHIQFLRIAPESVPTESWLGYMHRVLTLSNPPLIERVADEALRRKEPAKYPQGSKAIFLVAAERKLEKVSPDEVVQFVNDFVARLESSEGLDELSNSVVSETTRLSGLRWLPDHPQTRELLSRFKSQLLVKFPRLKETILSMLQTAGFPEEEIANLLEDPIASSAIWTPDSPQPQSARSQLWVPGQD